MDLPAIYGDNNVTSGDRGAERVLILVYLSSKLLPHFIQFGGKLFQLVVLYHVYERGSVCMCVW